MRYSNAIDATIGANRSLPPFWTTHITLPTSCVRVLRTLHHPSILKRCVRMSSYLERRRKLVRPPRPNNSQIFTAETATQTAGYHDAAHIGHALTPWELSIPAEPSSGPTRGFVRLGIGAASVSMYLVRNTRWSGRTQQRSAGGTGQQIKQQDQGARLRDRRAVAWIRLGWHFSRARKNRFGISCASSGGSGHPAALQHTYILPASIFPSPSFLTTWRPGSWR